MPDNQNIIKKTISDFLAFLQYKLDNDLLTMEEIESAARLVEKQLPLIGTTDDLARFYGKPTTNVSSVINRRMIQKPIRRVFYSFNAFRKIIPPSWKIHK